MSKLGLVIVLILMAGRIFAQDYFVLIEADNGQPFYVRVDSQLYSSSAKGHLILSHLKDSSYIITVGFPGQVFPEREFSFSVHQNDHAFRLKNEEGKGWWLVDDKGQELASLTGSGGGAGARIPGIKKDDAFSRLMSDLVKDTAVMYTTFTIGQPTPIPAVSTASAHVTAASDSTTETHPDSISLYRPIPRKDTAMTSMALASAASPGFPSVTPASAAPSVTPASAAPSAPMSVTPDSAALTATSPVIPLPSGSTPLYRTGTTGVTMLTEHRSTRSLRQVYTDHDSTGKSDTVVIIIPLDTPAQNGRPAVALSAPRVSNAGAPAGNNPGDSSLAAVSQDNGTKPDSSHRIPAHDIGPDTASLSTTRTSGKPTLPFVNSDCHNFATDYDVDKLRVKMLESARDDDRILAARKVFKTKCFSTRQIRALSEVFTTDASKFKFLETAYPFVSDEHFSELSSLLADPVYSSRFRAMTSH